VVLGLLAVLWLWVGWAFHVQRYATINWAAAWLGVAFMLQASLLGLAALVVRTPSLQGARPGRHVPRAWLGWSVAAVVVLGYPLAGLLVGRPLAQAELFGITPDPTALATLGLLWALPPALARGWRWLLSVVPLLSLAIGAATLWTMRAV
jgi:hypothetical protein